MSYDLAVFDPTPQLKNRDHFEAWYDERTEWEDDLDYNNPENASPGLRAWFHDIRQIFEPMNGPLSSNKAGESEEDHVADYSIGRDIIYVAFSWADAELAHAKVMELAARHRVGFLDASSMDGAAWFPAANGELELIHTSPEVD
ncbi:MAG: hypothetical protein ACOVPA_18370 [Rubrivivax sp.]|jgi:hypothetical protein